MGHAASSAHGSCPCQPPTLMSFLHEVLCGRLRLASGQRTAKPSLLLEAHLGPRTQLAGNAAPRGYPAQPDLWKRMEKGNFG